MSQQPLTVEIFRDADTAEIATAAIERGVAKAAEVAVGLTIVRADRKLRICADADAETVNPLKIRWPRLTADINLIATSRAISSTKAVGTHAIGVSGIMGPVRRATRVSVIRSVPTLPVARTTVHEIGHLFDVRPAMAVQEDPDHCAAVECIMHPEETVALKTRTLPLKGLAAILADYGFLTPKHPVTSTPEAVEEQLFCDGCTRQVGVNAFYLRKHKNGEFVPDHLLPFTRSD